MRNTAPFYPQKWNLEQWRELGFDNFEHAQYWERSSCGVLCLKMAIDAILSANNKPISPPIIEYIRKGLESGAYTDLRGWDHDGLAELAKKFGFNAVKRKADSAELAKALENNIFPIISIKWAFEPKKTIMEKLLFWKKRGGHLALVVGFESENGKVSGFYVHHTSIRKEYNWEYGFIPVKKFRQGYTGRCVFVNN